MAPTTPSSSLPKSKTHQRNFTPRTKTSASAAAVPPEQSRVTADIIGGSTHPDYAIPPPNREGTDCLVIVCCHAIFHPDSASPSFPLFTPHDEDNWHLAPFQKSNPATGKPGEHETFMSHIQAGIQVLHSESYGSKTLLVFSGGATKRSITPLSEARSYYHAALADELAQGHLGGGRAHQLFTEGRILLEEHATDSFQNLLFSILLFRRTTGTYPKQIRIITHAFKAKRFLDLHAPTLRWPPDRVQVQGIDPTMTGIELQETLQGERRHGHTPWLEDALGTGEVLSRKRKQRGWDKDGAERLSEGLEESVKELMHGTVPRVLPWMEHGSAIEKGDENTNGGAPHRQSTSKYHGQRATRIAT